MLRRAALLTLLSVASPCAAQSFDPDDYPIARAAPVLLVIEQERVFTESAFGKEIIALNEAEDAALRREGLALDKQFEEEEQALTVRRAELTPEAFRAEADAFDQKVVETRQAQEERGAALVQRAEQRRREFLRRIGPVLLEILEESGAAAVIEQRALLISKQDLNITDEVIKRLDAVYAAQQGLTGTPADPIVPTDEPEADQE